MEYSRDWDFDNLSILISKKSGLFSELSVDNFEIEGVSSKLFFVVLAVLETYS